MVFRSSHLFRISPFRALLVAAVASLTFASCQVADEPGDGPTSEPRAPRRADTPVRVDRPERKRFREPRARLAAPARTDRQGRATRVRRSTEDLSSSDITARELEDLLAALEPGDSETEAEAQTESESESDPDPDPESDPESDPETDSDADPDSDPESDPETDSDPEPASRPTPLVERDPVASRWGAGAPSRSEAETQSESDPESETHSSTPAGRDDEPGARRRSPLRLAGPEGSDSPAITAPPVATRRGDDRTRKDYGSDCLGSGCHKRLGEFPEVHGPVAALACDACHVAEDPPESHKFRPARPPETACTFCHTVTPAAKVVHKPFAELRCLECHDPHGGATRAYLRAGGAAATCATCHEPTKSEVLHEPVAKGDCALCHVSHESDQPHLLARPSRELCGTAGCHAELEAFIAASPHVHGPAAVDCSSCHLAHGGAHPFMLRDATRTLCLGCHEDVATKMGADAYLHGPLETEGGCSECHSPHASQSVMQLRAPLGELCLGCHDREIYSPKLQRRIANVALEIRSAQYKHGPVATGECQGCHFSHSGAYPRLLVEPYAPSFYQEFSETDYVLCFRCHERDLVLLERTTTATRFRDGDRNLHFVHVNKKKGRTCAVCHEMHASDHPGLVRKSVPFGSAGWQLPIGHRRTPTGGACASGCHRAFSYENGGAVGGAAGVE